MNKKLKLMALLFVWVVGSTRAEVADEVLDANMTFLALEGTQWQREDAQDDAFTLVFNPSAEGNNLFFSGKAACNFYGGLLYRQQQGFLVSQLWRTLMMCLAPDAVDENAFTRQMEGSTLDIEGDLMRFVAKDGGFVTFTKLSDSPFFDIEKLHGTAWRAEFTMEDILKPTTLRFTYEEPMTLHYTAYSETGYIVIGSFVERQMQVAGRQRPVLEFTAPIVFGEATLDLQGQHELEEFIERLSQTAGFLVFGVEGYRFLRFADERGDIIIGGFNEAVL